MSGGDTDRGEAEVDRVKKRRVGRKRGDFKNQTSTYPNMTMKFCIFSVSLHKLQQQQQVSDWSINVMSCPINNITIFTLKDEYKLQNVQTQQQKETKMSQSI